MFDVSEPGARSLGRELRVPCDARGVAEASSPPFAPSSASSADSGSAAATSRTRRRPSPRPARRPASSKRRSRLRRSGAHARRYGPAAARPSRRKSFGCRRLGIDRSRRRRTATAGGAASFRLRGRLTRGGIPRHLASSIASSMARGSCAAPISGSPRAAGVKAGGTPPRAPALLSYRRSASAGVAASETCRTQNSRKLSGSSSRAARDRARARARPRGGLHGSRRRAGRRSGAGAASGRGRARDPMTEMVRIAVVAIVTRRGPLALRADPVAGAGPAPGKGARRSGRRGDERAA